MTDESPGPAPLPATPGRVDLRVLDDPYAGAMERVIAATMERVAASPGRDERDDLGWLAGRYLRPAAAVAAVLALIAVGTVAATNRGREFETQPAVTLAGWAESQHVPTNGELLAAFHGYRR